MLLTFEGGTLPADVWPPTTIGNPRPVYITLSGISGAGKSTALQIAREMTEEAFGTTVGIDEKILHHPLLSRLFLETGTYGFEVQLNFMLQRCLIVKSWLAAGYNVVMERSHLEDLIFAQHLHRVGAITDSELEVYLNLHGTLGVRTPVPDALIYLDTSPEISAARLRADEEAGRRRKEYPNEETRIEWLRSWESLYRDLFVELQRNFNVIRASSEGDVTELRSTMHIVLREIREQLTPRRTSQEGGNTAPDRP